MKLYFHSNQSKVGEDSSFTIVFIHGNSMHSGFFLQQLESKILSHYNLIAIDLPGHGKSPKLESYSIFKLVDTLFETIKELDNVVLVGYSLGGHLAMQLLPKLNEKCKGIMVFGVAPLKLPLNVEEAYCIDEDSSKFLQRDIDEASRRKLAKIVYDKEDKFFDMLLESLEKTDGKFREDFASALMHEEIYNEVEVLMEFKGKILLAAGEYENVVNKNYIKRLTEKEVKNVGYICFENCGHSPHLEIPDTFNNLLSEFVESLIV